MLTFKEFLLEDKVIKLKWEISPAHTGKFASFHKRSWPMANYAGTDNVAARLECEDSYHPGRAKSGEHQAISVYVADWSPRDTDPNASAFKWRKLKTTAKTIDEAKSMAHAAVNKFPNFLPKAMRPEEK